MARPAMPQEIINANRVSIINAAMDMIRKTGISSVSARSLAQSIEINSALIYRYFSDIDEVILFACVHTLQDYSREMMAAGRKAEASDPDISDLDLYLLSWEIFCKHAFAKPEEYMILFFSKHSSKLYDVIGQYSELFPYKSGGEDDIILQGMFRTSNLRNRNLFVLHPILDGKKTEDDIMLINDMTVSFFYALLTQITGPSEKVTPEYQTKRMLKACRYLLGL